MVLKKVDFVIFNIAGLSVMILPEIIKSLIKFSALPEIWDWPIMKAICCPGKANIRSSRHNIDARLVNERRNQSQ